MGDRRGVTSHAFQGKRIRLNLVSVAAGNVLALGTGLLLARGLGPTSRGVLAAALLWPQFVNVVFELGIGDAVTYFASSGEANRQAVIQRARALMAIQVVVIWSVGVPLVYVALHHLGTAAVVSSLLVLAVGPAQLYTLIGMGYLNGVHRYGWFSALQVQSFAVTAAGYGVLYATGHLSVRTAVIANNVSVLSAFVVGAVVVRRTAHSDRPGREPRMARRLLAFGIRGWVGGVPHMLNDRVDQLVISVALAPRELGLYAIAATIATAPSFVGVAVSNSVLPTVAALTSLPEQVLAARRSIRLTFMMTLAAGVGVAIVMHPLIDVVFGRPFLGAVAPARVLALAAVMQAETRVCHGLLKGLGRPLDTAVSEAGALIVTGVGLAALVGSLGINGAALTSLGAYTTSTVTALYLASRRLDVRWFELLTAQRPKSLQRR